MVTAPGPGFRLFVLISYFVLSLATICFSAQKHRVSKTKQKTADTTGLTPAQKKKMLQNTLEEKLHYYYKDSAKINHKK